MNEVLILIGILMTISGIVVFILGYRRGVPNSILWATFPILHGLHEFTEYFMDNFTLGIFAERIEIFFSISGSFVLIAAALEYNGALQKPIGKVSALIGLLSVSYFIFGLPELLLEEIEETVLYFGPFQSDPVRFMQGIFLTIIAILAILFTYIYLIYNSKRGTISLDPKLNQTSIIAMILLGIYAFFEGFNWDQDIFITLRAISLSLFIVVPIFFILVNKIGLQSLIIIDEGGLPLAVYNFPTDDFLSFDTSEGERLLMASGFLTAITSFSGEVLHAGSSFSLRSNNVIFILSKYKTKIFALQTIQINKSVEKRFDQLKASVFPKIELVKTPEDTNKVEIKPIINELFSSFY